MSDFEEVRKEVFETYESAWSYLREHIPDGYEGYVISLPKVDINLEVDRKWE